MTTTKISITCIFSGKVLFSHEQEGNTFKLTVEAAVSARVSLAGANMAGANMAGANMEGANMEGAYMAGAYMAGAYMARAYMARANMAGANMAGANMAGANMEGANMEGAYMAGANMARANMARAYMEGANMEGANMEGAYMEGAYMAKDTILIGERPIFQIGPIGSRCAYFVAHITSKGVLVSAGCFKQKTIPEFRDALAIKHYGSVHATEYEAALTLIEKHVELWTPKPTEEANE